MYGNLISPAFNPLSPPTRIDSKRAHREGTTNDWDLRRVFHLDRMDKLLNIALLPEQQSLSALYVEFISNTAGYSLRPSDRIYQCESELHW